MKTVGNMVWATAAVGAGGVIIGIALMFAGDVLGRRDEAALRIAVSTRQAVAPTSQPASDVSESLTTSEGRVEAPPPEVVTRASEAVTVISSEERVVDRQQILEATQGNPYWLLLSQLELVLHRDGPQSGFLIASVADSPWAERVGLATGDVLTAINGKAVLDPGNMGQIASDFVNAPDVAVTIQRAGRQIQLQYHMHPSAQAQLTPASP